MAFSDLLADLDDLCLDTFGLAAEGATVLFTPQDGSGTQAIDGIPRKPALEEQYPMGGSQGTSVVRLFVRFTEISPTPKTGDIVTIGARNYDVAEVEVDRAGGAVLKLRAS